MVLALLTDTGTPIRADERLADMSLQEDMEDDAMLLGNFHSDFPPLRGVIAGTIALAKGTDSVVGRKAIVDK